MINYILQDQNWDRQNTLTITLATMFGKAPSPPPVYEEGVQAGPSLGHQVYETDDSPPEKGLLFVETLIETPYSYDDPPPQQSSFSARNPPKSKPTTTSLHTATFSKTKRDDTFTSCP